MSGRAEVALAPALRAAELGQVEEMAEMINGYAARGLMLPKSTAELYRLFREFVVVTGPEGEVVACGGLRVYRPDLAEIVGLAVREAWQGRGLGSAVVDRLVEDARGLGIGQVFAMTLTEALFHRRGFHTVPRERLPEKIHADCRSCPRRPGCREIAVLRELESGADALHLLQGRRLRVLHR